MLVKKLSYRDVSGLSIDDIGAIWRGFRYRSGRVVCIYEGPWGQVQVWAETEEEGLRVCLFALQAGGWGQMLSQGVFRAKAARGGRNGRVETMQVGEGEGMVSVSSRDGPSGRPVFASHGGGS